MNLRLGGFNRSWLMFPKSALQNANNKKTIKNLDGFII
ncbi:hypothetical protein SAMN05880574_106122 [Chryseobacterium sp. RU37D]|nr:hypothetical protein SAMN05880574_106122 [Chryseobacterium sp. RU37D]